MDPLYLLVLLLVCVAIWALVELVLVLRRARKSVDVLEDAAKGVDETLDEIRPVIVKLDASIDELQPAIARIDPLLKEANIAVEALSADLLEVNGVLRDVSSVSGAAGAVSEAVSGAVAGAGERVSRLFSRASGGAIPSGTASHLGAGPAPAESGSSLTSARCAGDASSGRSDDLGDPSADCGRSYYIYSDSDGDSAVDDNEKEPRDE